MDDTCPTLTFNTIGRHQSQLVRTSVASTMSPWLSKCALGDIHTIAISHGEGRFVASDELLETLKANGQIATQYVDATGTPSMDFSVNPNWLSRALPAPTVASWARWATRSAPARVSTRTSPSSPPATSSSLSSRAASSTSSKARAQVASNFYLVSISYGYRVSCAETLGVDGFLARRAVRTGTNPGRAGSAPDTSLIFSPSLNDLPEKRAKSELFAGFSHHV